MTDESFMFSKTIKQPAGVTLTLLLFSAGLLALAGASGRSNRNPEAAKPITLAGCVRNGNQSGEFTLATESGKVYGLRGSSVAFAEHVGHKVSVKGQLKPRLNKDDYDFEGSEVWEQAGKQVTQAVDIEVVSLKMISTSCPQKP